MANKERSTLVGVFPSLEQAEAAIKELLRVGFGKENIGFLMREDEDIKHQEEAEAAGQAAALRSAGGGITGGVIGGLLGALAALAIPGFGPVVSAGLLAAAGGAIAGTFTGLMSTIDLSEEEIEWYQGELESGRPLVAVRTNGRYSEALAILQIHGGYQLTRRHPEEGVATQA